VLKRNGFCLEVDSPESQSRTLLEIVGAIGLSFIEDDIDSFCVVKIGNKEVHRTETILKGTSPIWTVSQEIPTSARLTGF
jgi:hypothetical protein